MKKTTLLLILLILITVTISSCFKSPKTESTLSQIIDDDSSLVKQDNSPAINDESIPKMININYIAFGDSIARGAALVNPGTYSYPALVSVKLKMLVEEFSFQNFAIDGQTSHQLLEQLKTKGDVIKNSNVITISTGANNILGVFLNEAAKIFNDHGFSMNDVLNAGSIFQDVFSGSAEPERYQQLLLVFTELNSYISSDEFDVQIATAAAQLKADLPKIISEIRKNNKDAVIVVNSIYNPYKHLAIKIGAITLFSPSDETEKAVTALNKVIEDEQKTLGYLIAPVYDGFNDYTGNERLENAFFSIDALNSTNIDVHPTRAGHQLIADIVFETIKPKIN